MFDCVFDNKKMVRKSMLLNLTVALIASFFCGHAIAIETPVNLKCEHLVNPLGIDAPQPRFTWQITEVGAREKQARYQVIVGTDSLAVNRGQGKSWTSPKTNSVQQLAIYKGQPLNAFTKYFWKVITFSGPANSSRSSAIASFETGMMQVSNWKGSWISDGQSIDTKPAAYFRKSFNLLKKIVSARAYIAAAGLYELYINGEKIGQHRLDPMYTRFDRRNLYISYDVTTAVQNGKNAIGVWMGNGWYNFQSIGVWDFERAPWRNRPAFCLDLRLTLEDGTVQTISSDDSWKTSLSPVIFNSIYTGEHYNANLEQRGWNTANFEDSSWKRIQYRQAPSQNIVSQVLQPITNVEKIASVSMKKMNDTTYVFDLGRNISGVSEIRLNGDSGTVVNVIHGERLQKNGLPDLSNVDYFLSEPTRSYDPFATDIYTLSGKGEQSFMPRFNYKGFQYVAVTSSKPIALIKESLVGYFMHNDVEAVGNIKTSSDLVNKIYAATNSSFLSNLFGYPTDCPQREKNGWTGDAHIASEVGLYNFDCITIYEKWMADHRDEQQPNGVLPSIIPTGGWGYEWGNGPDWTSTIAIIPWNVYLFYGDTKLLSDCYSNIKRYVEHIDALYPNGLTSWGLGDWAPVKSRSPVELTSSVYYYVDANILAKAAKILGKKEDHIKYAALAEKIKNAINNKYLNAATGIYAEGHQSEQSVPLCWGVVPDSLKNKVAAHLADSVKANNYQLDVGILGAKAILNALSENGQAQTAYKLASQVNYPSWGFWIVNGATTLYENWNINAPRDLSMNHIMFGEVGAWLYKGIGGIKPDEAKPGFDNVLLAPNFVQGLDYFESSHKGPYGNIVSSWKRKGNTVIYSATIPPNSSASVKLPITKSNKILLNKKQQGVKDVYQLQAGEHEFQID